MPSDKLKVLYIGGYGRSGSTILHDVLARVDGFIGVGEVNRIWDLGLVENRPCGCGVPFKDCEFWKIVMDKAFGGIDQIDTGSLVYWRNSSRTRCLASTILPSGNSQLNTFREHLDKLYESIQSVTGSRVIVDNSKSLAYARLLSRLSPIELYMIHVIRDPRGVVQSLLERNERRRVSMLRRYNSVRNSIVWDTVNVATEMLCTASSIEHRVVRYEDFVCRPREALREIFDLIQENVSDLPLIGLNEASIGITHSVTGRNRFQARRVELRPDEEWKAQMNFVNKAVVNLLTWPLRARYGYT
jgi:hypothetical protein